MFVLDPTEEADTMREQEQLRTTISRDIPMLDSQSGLYPDLADLPPPNGSSSIDVHYYTKDRLRAKLNEGQHVVSVGGHGNQ